MIPYILLAPLRLILGTLYPAYASYKAVRTKNVREYVKWMMYWIVFAAFSAMETFTDIFVAFWFPFYYEVKILLLIWLISPVSRGSLGSSIIYRKFVHPNLMKKEDEIDRWMQRLRMQGYDSISYYGTRAFSYVSNLVMQTAIRAPTYMAQVLSEDERSRALELVPDQGEAAADVDNPRDDMDGHVVVDGAVIEEMDVEDVPLAGPSQLRAKRKPKNTSIYQFEFSSDDEDGADKSVAVVADQTEVKEEAVTPPPKRAGRKPKNTKAKKTKDTSSTDTVRRTSRRRNPSKN